MTQVANSHSPQNSTFIVAQNYNLTVIPTSVAAVAAE
jgi:hypothetical protein